MTTLASARDRNHSTLRHSSRSIAVEALVVGVLPRLARVDQGCADAGMGEPFEDRSAEQSCRGDRLRILSAGAASLTKSARDMTTYCSTRAIERNKWAGIDDCPGIGIDESRRRTGPDPLQPR